MACIISHHRQHRTAAAPRRRGQYLLYASEKAEHHGVVGLFRPVDKHILTAGMHVLDMPKRQLPLQHRQRLTVPFHRRHRAHIRGEGQGQIPQPTARVADAVRLLEVRLQLRCQLPVEIRPAAGIVHIGDALLCPLKHGRLPSARPPGRAPCPAVPRPRRTAGAAASPSAPHGCRRRRPLGRPAVPAPAGRTAARAVDRG